MEAADVIAEQAGAWAQGWSLTRRTAAPTRHAAGWVIQVGQPGHERRFILPRIDGLGRLGTELHAPGTWLKICAPLEQVAALLGPTWQLQPQEYLMSLRWTATPSTVPANYVLQAQRQGAIVLLELKTLEGELAAQARCAITGRHAVVDQVVTEPAHRRRGLGALLMKELGRHALRAGAEFGVLVATEDGRALYQSLGWGMVSPVTAAVAVSAPAPAASA